MMRVPSRSWLSDRLSSPFGILVLAVAACGVKKADEGQGLTGKCRRLHGCVASVGYRMRREASKVVEWGLIVQGLVVMVLGVANIVDPRRPSRQALRIERLFNPSKEKPSWLASENAYRVAGMILLSLGAASLVAGLL